MSCTVTLKIRAESTAWGETVGVAGSIPQLSTWGATAPPPLSASPFPIWTTTLTLPPNTLVQYKYVILSSSKIARWEVLPSSEENRSFTSPEDGEALTIDDGTIGDATRTSQTVTPSTTPVTTPTRPQKPSNLLTDSTVETTPPLEQHSVAEFVAQLDNSRRQVEHVRAALRRIRRIPTPDALPTPQSTPDQSADLSHDAAAALVTDTLINANADVEIIREKIHAVRTGNSKPATSAPNPAVVASLLSFAVALLAIGVVVVDPRIGDHVRCAVGVTGEKIIDRFVVAWGKIKTSAEHIWVVGKCWQADMRLKMGKRLLEGTKEMMLAIERAREEFAQDWMATIVRVGRDAGNRVRENVRKITARVGELRDA